MQGYYKGGSVSAAFNEMARGSSADGLIDDVSRESSPEPAVYKGPPTKQPVKRKLAATAKAAADGNESDEVTGNKENSENPAFYVKSAKRGSGAKNKNDQMMSMMDNRTDMMKDFTSSFATLVKKKNENQDPVKSVDNIDYWCKILGNRVRDLEANIRGRFMHHVDGLVLDAKDGIWAP